MKRLREWRRWERRLRVQELAAAAGVMPETITDIEHGRRLPGPAVIGRICTALGVTPQEVAEFAAADGQHAPPPRPARPISHD